MKRPFAFLRDTRAASALEFALVLPILLTLIVGILEVGVLFYGVAGMKHAVGEGARYATLYPAPSNSAVVTQITNNEVGLTTGTITGPTVTACTSSSQTCKDISMSYTVTPNFGIFRAPPVTVTETRRVFTN